MIEPFKILWSKFFGLEAEIFSIWHMCQRSLIIYILGAFVARFNPRFLSMTTIFAIIIGELLADGITGTAPFDVILGTVIFIVGVHWSFLYIIFHNRTVERWVKGTPKVLVNSGEIQWDAMRKQKLTEEDLLKDLRSLSIDKLSVVKQATFENDGSISFILTVPPRRR